MGIYDRDYYQPQQPSFSIRAPGTIVGWIIVLNIAVYIGMLLATAYLQSLPDGQLFSLATGEPVPLGQRALNAAEKTSLAQTTVLGWLSASDETLTRPWLWWQFLTYGFVHDLNGVQHIAFNMLGLFFLGRAVEQLYGSKEFLRLYLAMLVFGSVVWALFHLFGDGQRAVLLGASGAVAGVVVLFAINFPHQTLLLFFVLPVPAWVVGILVVGMDAYGAMYRGAGDNVAYTVHLAGAAFAFLYVRQKWNLTRLTERFPWSMPSVKRGPKLRLHDPAAKEEKRLATLQAEEDRILEKIHREGIDSLTRKERRTMEKVSEEAKKRTGR